MYDDPSFIRDKGIRVYVNEHEKAEIENAARNSGRERASFMRDAALVVARYISSRRVEKPQGDLLQQMQARLAQMPAANDSHPKFCLAS